MGYVQALKTLTAGRVTVSRRCVGMMDKLIAQCVGYMKMRTQGGKSSRIPGPAMDAGRHGGEPRRGSGLTQRAIETLMRGERGTMEASTAKLYATEALGRVVDAAVQITRHGYMREAA